MRRIEIFSFRVNPKEKQLIELLAERLCRSQSDAIRYVIRKAIEDLESNEKMEKIKEVEQ